MIGIVASLLVICFSSVGLYLFGRDPYSETAIRRLIESAYNHQRPGGGRLSAARYSSLDGLSLATPDLARAQILLLRVSDSHARQRLQGYTYLAAGEWQKFVQLTNKSTMQGADSATLNNLGASFLALSENAPTSLLKALDAFERASLLDPNAPEPLFNLVITYKKLRLPKLAEEAYRRYSAVDLGSPWRSELGNSHQTDETVILHELEESVETNSLVEAERLFQANADLCRRVAMQFALSNEAESEPLLHFIANQIERRYGDHTISAMLEPLFTEQREQTIAFRKLVNQGAELYVEGKYPESLSAYNAAAGLARNFDSTFDRLWLDLNRVDTQIRLGEFDAARDALSRLIPVATSHGFLWLNAKA